MGVMLQAFYWDCPQAENCEHQWWSFIQSKLPAIAKAGFTAVWLPPANKAANCKSMGYDPYDYYDLGEFDPLGPQPQFLDQKDGIERQLNTLSNQGLLSRFVGMTTDSRSFLSYTRHEYFRRLLCNILGSDMERGLVPDDLELVGHMVRDICHDNARRYFGFFADSSRGV